MVPNDASNTLSNAIISIRLKYRGVEFLYPILETKQIFWIYIYIISASRDFGYIKI